MPDMNEKVVLLSLLLAFGAFAQGVVHDGGSSPVPRVAPLSPEEQATVVAEIRRMVKTPESEVTGFVVKDVTPELIERAYATPSFLAEPRNVRENGLIFAGRGPLLAFNKPSDVIEKLARWFPQEVAAARNDPRRNFFMHLHLYGPFPGWEAEPASFLALWNCLPTAAWIRPDGDPFARRLGDGLPLLPGGATSSATHEYDFGFCVRERNGRRNARTEAELPALVAEREAMARQVVPYLRRFFASFLTANGCRGSGPDDCVVVLRAWAELDAADPALAATLRTLEPTIAPDAPLPPFQKALHAYGPGGQEGEPRTDAILRRGAFLRAKLQSVLAAPDAWPPGALDDMLAHLQRQRSMTAQATDHRWSMFTLSYYNEPINPWGLVAQASSQQPAMRAAIMRELGRLTQSGAGCSEIEPWLEAGKPSIGAEFALPLWTEGRSTPCITPNWAWLMGPAPEAGALRAGYLALLERPGHPARRDELLTTFTDQGGACFNREPPSPDWTQALCRAWIAAPQNAPLSLAPRAVVDAPSAVPPSGSDEAPFGPAQTAWLDQLVEGLSPGARKELHRIALDLERREVRISIARLWSQARPSFALLELRFHDERQPVLILLLDNEGLTPVAIPARFEPERQQVLRVSDLDGDGNVELWWGTALRACQHDASDLLRDIDCSIDAADMGEVNDGVLTYFRRSAPVAAATSFRVPRFSRAAGASVASPATECNRVLVGSVLAERLPIRYADDEEGGASNVIAIACRPHPERPGETVVALFFDAEQRDEQTGLAEAAKDFAMAIIDLGAKRVVAFHRSTVVEDASIRIDGGSLKLDLAPYVLKPGTRALGVRMDIGHSPRCAEGGESNYLTLFVQEGEALRPVLKDLAMTQWRVAGPDVCGESANYILDTATLSIELGDPGAGGWRDLRLIARHRIGGPDPVPAETSATDRREVVILRAKGSAYETAEIEFFR